MPASRAGVSRMVRWTRPKYNLHTELSQSDATRILRHAVGRIRRTLQRGNSYVGVRRPSPGYKVAASGDVLPQIAQIARVTRGIEVEPVPVHPTTRNGASPWALPRRRAGQRKSTVRSVRPRKRVRCSALRLLCTCGAAPAARFGASLIAASHRLGAVVRMVCAG